MSNFDCSLFVLCARVYHIQFHNLLLNAAGECEEPTIMQANDVVRLVSWVNDISSAYNDTLECRRGLWKNEQESGRQTVVVQR